MYTKVSDDTSTKDKKYTNIFFWEIPNKPHFL